MQFILLTFTKECHHFAAVKRRQMLRLPRLPFQCPWLFVKIVTNLKSSQNSISNGTEVLRTGGISKLVLYKEKERFGLDAVYIETETILPKAIVFYLNHQVPLLMNFLFSRNKEFIRVPKEDPPPPKIKERVEVAQSV